MIMQMYANMLNLYGACRTCVAMLQNVNVSVKSTGMHVLGEDIFFSEAVSSQEAQ